MILFPFFNTFLMNDCRRYPTSLVLAFALLASVVSCRHHPPGSVVDWHKLHELTRTLLKDSAFDRVFPLDSFIYQSAGAEIADINEFMGFSMDCVAASAF